MKYACGNEAMVGDRVSAGGYNYTVVSFCEGNDNGDLVLQHPQHEARMLLGFARFNRLVRRTPPAASVATGGVQPTGAVVEVPPKRKEKAPLVVPMDYAAFRSVTERVVHAAAPKAKVITDRCKATEGIDSFVLWADGGDWRFDIAVRADGSEETLRNLLKQNLDSVKDQLGKRAMGG